MASRSSGEQQAFEQTVPDGTPLNEAVSILIKELRRGRELEALYWARQIEGSYHKYVWRRLAIFAAEDVGLGNPLAVVIVQSLAMAYDTEKRDSSRGKPDGNLITMAVMVLARSMKNREIDHLKNVEHSLTKHGWKPDVPDYAIDAHTRRGRDVYTDPGERDVLWFTEWSKVIPETGPYDARLWHLRRLVRKGLMESEAVEALAREWEAAGELVHGIDGAYPVVDGG
jgi:hypothetical protein